MFLLFVLGTLHRIVPKESDSWSVLSFLMILSIAQVILHHMQNYVMICSVGLNVKGSRHGVS
jgi:hypothetical protein